jgi:FtsP/CotA-like multicopper oxidase with cupredoxin domain
MKCPSKLGLTAIITAGLVACGGSDSPDDAPAASEPAAAPAAASASGIPDWYQIDNDAETVVLQIAAQMDGGWKMNGMALGAGTITVPVGYEITVEFTNDDPAMAHSLGIDAQVGGYPAMFEDPQPAFSGAVTGDPTSMTESTLPGETESFTFTADAAGEYAMVCYIPAHAVTGMWVRFNVSDGEPGVST